MGPGRCRSPVLVGMLHRDTEPATLGLHANDRRRRAICRQADV